MQIGHFKQHKIKVQGNDIAVYDTEKGDQTILLIHGGPGTGAQVFFESHTPLIDAGYRVMTWDQLGCGESATPPDDSFWQVNYFVEELEAIFAQFNLTNVHLVGRSWGGVIAIEFALRHQDKLSSLILGGATADSGLMNKGFENVRNTFGPYIYETMLKHEARGTTNHPEYQSIITLLLYKHFCRLENWPEALKKVKVSESAGRSREIIFGKHLFRCDGKLKDYNRINDLYKITCKTLIIHGAKDYISLECAMQLNRYIPNSELFVIPEASHIAFYEFPDCYFGKMLSFLNHVTQVKLASPNPNL